MRKIFLKACVSLATLGLGLSLAAPPVMAASADLHGGGGARHGGSGGARQGASGGGFARQGGGGGAVAAQRSNAWQGRRYNAGSGGYGGGGYGGGYYGGGGGYYGNGYGYGGAALGLGLLGGAIVSSQYPYYDSGSGYDAEYDNGPQDVGGDPTAYCASTFRSYDPASGTYLGYDGLPHSCP